MEELTCVDPHFICKLGQNIYITVFRLFLLTQSFHLFPLLFYLYLNGHWWSIVSQNLCYDYASGLVRIRRTKTQFEKSPLRDEIQGGSIITTSRPYSPTPPRNKQVKGKKKKN